MERGREGEEEEEIGSKKEGRKERRNKKLRERQGRASYMYR